MPRAPLLIPALAFIGSIVADAYGLVAWACAAGVAAAAFRRARPAAAFVLLGALCAAWRGHPAEVARETRTLVVTGTIVGDVVTDGELSRAPLALDGRAITVRLQAAHPLAAGERVLVRGRLAPLDDARNPGEPSSRAIGRAEGIGGELAGTVIARAPPDARDARTWAPRARAALAARLRGAMREPEATIVAGALWGERGALPADLRADFQATGTVHVLVTAGLHLGVLAGVVLALLRLCAVPRVAASLAAIPCIGGYAWLTGAHLPSQRAAVMISIALLARACGARVGSWNALALAALIVAALWPAAVTTVSFALSFSCIAAIVLFARPLEHALARVRMPDRVREALALTIATQVGVWPLSAATFGLIAPYAVAANAFVVPATAVALVGGVMTLACAHLPFFGAAAAALTAFDVDAILRVVTLVAAFPGARVAVAPPPLAAIVAYDVAALFAGMLFSRRPRGAALLLAVASALVLTTTVRLPDGRLSITMLDVGQADGIVVRTPRGHVIVIDSGGRLERGPTVAGTSPAEIVGERVVLAYLRREGVREVALLLNTHPHGDHVGGFPVIVRGLHVDAIADSGQRYGGRAFNDGLREAGMHRVPVHIARCGDRWSTGDGVVLSILSPCGALLADGKNDVNENSIVAMLQYGAFRMLFTGDAGFETEQRLLREGVDLRAAVLKVGHHGSAYASKPAFLRAVRPRVGLVSVGRHNVFGHPAPSTIGNLEAAGTAVYRTDRCGAITLSVTSGVRVDTMIRC